MRRMAEDNMLCLRIPLEVRAQLELTSTQLTMSISAVVRQLLMREFGADGSIDPMYAQSRQTAAWLARAAIEQALGQLPETYEEALARYGDPREGG